MRSTKTGDKKDEPAGRSQWFHRHESLIPFLLVLVAVAFNLYHLYPELAFKVTGPNDQVLHLLLTDSAMEAITRGQNFTDPRLRATGMGFPLLHYYQPLAHVSAALIHALTLGILSLVNMVDWTTYLLLSLFPISIYWSMRCLGFEILSSAMGGFVASFTATPGLFGLDFHSYVWRGHGLYTQLWGQVLLPPALAMSYRVLREGRGYFWATLLLSATLMSHLIFGLIAFVSLGALAFLPAIRLLTHSDHPRVAVRGQWTRLLILLAMVLVVTSYFLVPMFLDRSLFNPSGVGEDPRKYASYGYSVVLRALARGDLFDFDRFPSFTILLAIGLAICLFRWREERYLIPVAIFLVWLLLYFGRSPWGILIDLVPMGRDIHIHRFIAGVHLGGIFLIAVALAALWHWAMAREGVQYLVAAVALTLLIMMPVYSERRSYLAQNSADMRENQRAMAAENPELSNLFENLKQLPPGRVYAGLTGNWGVEYAIGAVPVLKLLHAEKIDMMGDIYHAFSLNSDVQNLFDENRWELYNLYNVRYVVAPEGRTFPSFVRPLQQFGRHRLYQVETTGYFDVVSADLAFAGTRNDFFPGVTTWLATGLPDVKQHPVVVIGGSGRANRRLVPLSQAKEVIPKIAVSAGPSRGIVLSEEIGNNYFAAKVAVERESMLLLKATYHPNWRATVNGVKTDTVMLMPSFVGIQLSPGEHEVRIEYRPRGLRVILLSLGLLSLLLIWIVEKRGIALSTWFTTGVAARMPKSLRRPRSNKRRRNRRDRRRR